MPTPHKHAALIKAWAEGEEIETDFKGRWIPVKEPAWNESHFYRIKPKEPNYGTIAAKGYTGGTYPPMCKWTLAANAVIEAYKKHHDIS